MSGVWSKTEDENLKAAVTRHGIMNWSRVSALVGRKSDKECKSRWHQLFDPAIKKIDWTPAEDEELLHLATVLPAQWSTIAQHFDRSQNECHDHYQKLIHSASENCESGDDPRKLRPGEIDPNPESKPAIDEDDKEMRSEKIARFRGKKAKRKARERQLEETRKLVSLQRRPNMNLPTPRIPDYGVAALSDELHVKGMRQAAKTKSVRSGFNRLPQPKNEYLITVQHALDDDEEPEEKMEEDISDGIVWGKPEEEFDDSELQEAHQMIQEEAKLLPVAMGHEDEDIDESVKVASIQKEFDIVKKRLDDETKKSLRLEQKIKLRTDGYQMRAAKLESQVETTFKQMVTAGREYECVQALQRQEVLAASNRIDSISEAVQKQQELEKTLQNRYGDLLVRTVPEQVEEANQIIESSEMTNLTG